MNDRLRVKGTDYIYEKFIADGSYGTVSLLKSKNDGKFYAVKSSFIDFDKNKVNKSSDRELAVFNDTEHENIIKLKEVHTENGYVNFIMEYAPFSLADVIEHGPVPEPVAKGYAIMLLRGLMHLHVRGITHRDVKPQNILINEDGIVKICDFGTAFISHRPELCVNDNNSHILPIGSMFYKSPEAIVDEHDSDPSSDMWAVGCVVAEMLIGQPLFPCDCESLVLQQILKLLGHPTEKNWPTLSKTKNFENFTYDGPEESALAEKYPKLSPLALDFISCLLRYNSSARMTAKEALRHDWFSTEPIPLISPFNGQVFCEERSRFV